MAAQLFPQSSLAAGGAATVSTANPDVTGASGSFATVVTGDAAESIVTGIRFRAVTTTGAGTILYIYLNISGTRYNVGHVVVPPGVNPAVPGTVPWEGSWSNPNAGFFLGSGQKFDVAPYSGTTVYHCFAIGADYA